MMGNKTRLRSTMIQTVTSGVSVPVSNKFSQREAMVNASMVESVLIPNSNSSPMKTETDTKRRRKHSKTLREKIREKQLKLETEWDKTQMYQGRVSKYLGEGELQRVNMQRSTFAMTRIVNVIDKVRRSRIATAGGVGCECIELEHS